VFFRCNKYTYNKIEIERRDDQRSPLNNRKDTGVAWGSRLKNRGAPD